MATLVNIARSARKAASTSVLAAAAAAAVLVPAGGASASDRPVFQVPFPCGEQWNGATYHNHAASGNDFALDLNRGEGNDDFRAPVLASQRGMVERWVEWDNDHIVEIHHGNDWSTEYRHLDQFAVDDGAWVAQGQLIGYVGDNGTEVAHLHYEQQLDDWARPVHFDGTRIDYSYTYNGPVYQSSNCSPDVHPTAGRPAFRLG